MIFDLFEETKKDEFFKKILNHLINSINEAVIITENNKVLFVNDHFTTYTGYTKEETLEMSPLDFIHPDFVSVAKKNMKKLSEAPYEIWAKRKDGSQFPVLLLPKMLNFENRYFRTTIIKDLTQEKQLLQKELLLTKTFEQSHESIVITDHEATIIYANDKFCKLTGYSKKEILGENPKILQSGTHSKKFYQDMWKTLVSGKEWKGEFQNKKKDGTIYWEKATITPIQNEDGKIQFYLGIKEDITVQKQIEKNFKDTEIKYKELIENAPLAIVTIDTKGNVMMINQMMVDFLGSPSKKETMRINVLDFPLLQKSGVSAQFQKCLDSGEKIKFENNYTSKWSKKMFYRLYLSPIEDKDKKITGVLAIAEDISKEKEYEKGILQAKIKAEEADKLKDIFLANISHELRTPLNAITGFSEFLKDANNLTSQQYEYVEYISSSANHLLKLIEDLVDISQAESKQLTINPENFKVGDLIASIIPIVKNQLSYLQKDSIDLIINPHEKTKDIIVNVDKSRFTQIITNLIDNAIKYTEAGEISLNCSVQDKELVIAVKDTGIGIPEDKHQLIFERFRQGEEKLSRKYGGSGIGLTIVKELVTLMKGRIWLKSTQGKGSTFFVAFPIATPEKHTKKNKETTQKHDSQKFKNGKFTVLLVEDNTQNKILIRRILQEYDFNVLEAGNGKEAVEIFNNTPYINVILMDLQMPIMDGIEATKIIRKNNSTIPIIAQTALAFPEDKTRALDAGCNDVLLKPFKKDQLLLKIIDNLKMS